MKPPIRSMPGADVWIEIDSRICIVTKEVEATIIAALFALLTYANPEWGKHARYGGKVPKHVPKEIRNFEQRNGVFSAGRGALARVRKLLEDNGLTVGFDDQRVAGRQLPPGLMLRVLERLKTNGRTLYPHQHDIARAMLDRENAFVRAPTGSGKTMAELLAILVAERWALVLVPTQTLAEQWRDDALAAGIPEDVLGFVGDGVRKLAPITVALPVSTEHWLREETDEDGVEMFGTLVVDEVQGAAASSFGKVIDRVPAKYRLGVSASERRKDRKEFLIYDAFGDAPAVDVKREDLIRAGVIRDVEVRMVPTAFESPTFAAVRKASEEWRARLAAGEKISPFTARRLKRDDMLAWTKLFGEMRDDVRRNRLIRDVATAAMLDGGQCLVFVHLREHAKELVSGLRARNVSVAKSPAAAREIGLLLGGKADAKEYQRTRELVGDGTVRIAVATYKSTGVGTNLPSLSDGLCGTPIHTNKQFGNQVRGRISRKGARPAVLWYLWDREVFGDEPVRALMRWNSNVKLVFGLGGDERGPVRIVDARESKGVEWGDR